MPKEITNNQLQNSLNKKLQQNNLDNVIFDTREKNTKVMKYIMDQWISPNFQKLPEWDYFFPQDDILIERKNVDDLNKSLTSWRLYNQVNSLTNTWKRIFLVIEWELGYGKLHYNWVLGAQISLSIKYNVSLIRTKNFLETVNLIVLMSEKIRKWGYWETVYYQQNTNAEYVKDPEIKILTSLPWCWITTASNILEYCGSIRNFVNMDSKELENIDWLWPKTIQKWKEILG